MKQNRHTFNIEFYGKDELLLSFTHNFINDDFKYRMNELENEIKYRLEQLVIQHGWVTTFVNTFAIVKPVNHFKKIALMIIYRPSFNYQTITNINQMRDELSLMRSTLKI